VRFTYIGSGYLPTAPNNNNIILLAHKTVVSANGAGAAAATAHNRLRDISFACRNSNQSIVTRTLGRTDEDAPENAAAHIGQQRTDRRRRRRPQTRRHGRRFPRRAGRPGRGRGRFAGRRCRVRSCPGGRDRGVQDQIGRRTRRHDIR